MNAKKENVKSRIFQAAIALITSEEDVESITSRQIAAKANVNLALINYYYQSKENLLNLAGMSMMEDLINYVYEESNGDLDATAKLKNLLLTTADFAFLHHKIFKIVIKIDIKQGCKNSNKMIMPLLKEIFPDKNQSELNIIALQLLMPFQNIVAYPELYNDLLSTNFFDDDKRSQKVNEMIDNIIRIR